MYKLKGKANLAQCTTCHKIELPQELTSNLKWGTILPHFNSVILPNIDLGSNEKE